MGVSAYPCRHMKNMIITRQHDMRRRSRHRVLVRVGLVVGVWYLALATSRWRLALPTVSLELLEFSFPKENTTSNTSFQQQGNDTHHDNNFRETINLFKGNTVLTTEPITTLNIDIIDNDDNVNQPKNPNNNFSNHRCFRLNSEAWLEGPRVGNIPIPENDLGAIMHPHGLMFKSNILDILLKQTLCYKTGRFRTIRPIHASTPTTAINWNASDSHHIQDWQIRLLYLALHRKFHIPAYPEYQLRQECDLSSWKTLNTTTTSSSLSSSPTTTFYPRGGISNFDYECPNAKFLVTVLKSVGMGATIRGSAMPSILMALSTDRIPLFVSSLDANDVGESSPLTTPFLLASCPRQDFQCVFAPLSPCVLTMNDLRNATLLSKAETRTMKRNGVYITPQHEHVRVLLHDTKVTEPFVHHVARTKAYQIIWNLLEYWKNETTAASTTTTTSGTSRTYNQISAEQWKVMTAAANSFLPTKPLANQQVSNPKDDMTPIVLRAVLLYLMRPNAMARGEIDKQLSVLPWGEKDRQYYGLPIRGSDKCRFESTCLPFERYMERVVSKWRKHQVSGKRGTILMTSEDPNILPLRLSFVQNESFPMEIVVNTKDVQQGHGRPKWYEDNADAIMISSLAAWKMQLQSNVLVGNCCSNFHLLLFEMMRAGCGADPNYYTELECLNDVDDPRFRICCERTQDAMCASIWAHHKALTNVTAIKLLAMKQKPKLQPGL